MIKRLLSLLWNGADQRQYFLEIGSYFLRKGVDYEVGQIYEEKRLQNPKKELYKAKVIKSLTYDFGTNKVYHTFENVIINPNQKFVKK